VEIAALYEFDENYSNMGHTFRLFLHISPYKGHKGWLLRKMPEVIIKLDKRLKD
jgi:hypothetical protein